MLLKKVIPLFLAVIFSCTMYGCSFQNASHAEENNAPSVTGALDFQILDIGKADAIILKTQNHAIVIDCGETKDGDTVVSALSESGINTIDYLFITHFDKDHVGGAAEVIRNLQVNNIITPNYSTTTKEYKSFLAAMEQTGCTPLHLTETMVLTLDDVLLTVYPPQKSAYAAPDNDFSLAIHATHGENTFLFAGDAETVRLAELLSQVKLPYDFLKVPHHGIYNDGIESFIKTVKPAYAAITCSKKKMPDDSVIAALKSVDSRIYYTVNGEIRVHSDGQTIAVSQT